MIITRITRKPVDYPFTVTLSDGNPVTPLSVQVALLNRSDAPTAATTWTTVTYAANTVTVMIAGPDASPTGAIVIPSPGASLWAKVADATYVDAVRLDQFRVEGSSPGVNAALSPRTIPAGGTNGQVLGVVDGVLAWVTVTTFPGTTGTS